MLRSCRTSSLVPLLVGIFLACPFPARGQLSEAASWAADIDSRYRILPDLTYLVADGHESRLDLYLPRSGGGPHPTLVFIHGGGWVGGSKQTSALRLLPYLEMGWAVANLEYRLARVSLAPAAVEDCRCALRWLIAKAGEYGLDPGRVVLTGSSAGGHLALMTGMLSPSAGLDRRCPGPEPPPVAAVVNWYGITDVLDLLDGSNRKDYAVAWLGTQPDREQIARGVSPLSHIQPGLPPVLTIHGDADPVVPYRHALRLHQALDEAGVPNRLLTIPGGEHGRFGREQTLGAYAAIRSFLKKHVPDPDGADGGSP